MATSGDISVTQDGGQGNVKLHPYFVTLVRWCMSCVWSTATVILHRLLTTPLQPITGPKPAPPRVKVAKRAPGTEHLHPEPKVECQLLHQPAKHSLDVIFVHGLYGSLGNTWRQGDWRQKYTTEPKIITLRDHSKPNSCKCNQQTNKNSFNDKRNNSKENPFTIADTKSLYDNEKKTNNNNQHRQNKYANMTDSNDSDLSNKKFNEKLSKKVLPEENDLITEQFYNNTLKDQVGIDNFETQAKFVSDLFKKETDCDITCETYKQTHTNNDIKCSYESTYINNRFKSHGHIKCDIIGNNDIKYNNEDTSKYADENFKHQSDLKAEDDEFKCKFNEINDLNECKCEEKKCEVGCGCICNECYSTCWPRDWIKEDFPEARVISINYTSDPYLWRPLWIKENKRLNLYQRAEQMIDQLLEMGVGDKPIVWVGHSKGGLFIKQIYCEGFEAYVKTNKNLRTNDIEQKTTQIKEIEIKSPETNNGITAENIDTIISHFNQKENQNFVANYENVNVNENRAMKQNDLHAEQNDNHVITNENNQKHFNSIQNVEETRENDIGTNDNYTEQYYSYKERNDNCAETNDDFFEQNDNYTGKNDIFMKYDNYRSDIDNNARVMNETAEYENVFEEMNAKNNFNVDVNEINDNIVNVRIENGDGDFKIYNGGDVEKDLTSSIEESTLRRRAALWQSSRGFLFYSVPHRGSPLADIKTPVTARSVDLLEIAKDCPLVLELQTRWERAVGKSGSAVPTGGSCEPCVHSVVETCRTLMSVLWLRIVSTDSADAGVGTLSGICVDHREICKPASRSCRLYTTLTDLIRTSLACTRRVNINTDCQGSVF